jgi:hypothetical protein
LSSIINLVKQNWKLIIGFLFLIIISYIISIFFIFLSLTNYNSNISINSYKHKIKTTIDLCLIQEKSSPEGYFYSFETYIKEINCSKSTTNSSAIVKGTKIPKGTIFKILDVHIDEYWFVEHYEPVIYTSFGNIAVHIMYFKSDVGQSEFVWEDGSKITEDELKKLKKIYTLLGNKKLIRSL